MATLDVPPHWRSLLLIHCVTLSTLKFQHLIDFKCLWSFCCVQLYGWCDFFLPVLEQCPWMAVIVGFCFCSSTSCNQAQTCRDCGLQTAELFSTTGILKASLLCCWERHLFLGLQLGGVHVRYLGNVRAWHSWGDLSQEGRGTGISALVTLRSVTRERRFSWGVYHNVRTRLDLNACSILFARNI